VNLKFALPAALCFFPALLWGQLANQPPMPQWLPAGEPSVRFDGMERLLKAILFVAGDAAVKVSLNGHDIGTANPGEVATTFDVTSALLAEKNVLRLVSTGKQAALLELNGDLARKRWIVSDGTWTGGKPLGLISADPEKNPFDFKKTLMPITRGNWQRRGRNRWQLILRRSRCRRVLEWSWCVLLSQGKILG
jgi:hypothetical protein